MGFFFVLRDYIFCSCGTDVKKQPHNRKLVIHDVLLQYCAKKEAKLSMANSATITTTDLILKNIVRGKI